MGRAKQGQGIRVTKVGDISLDFDVDADFDPSSRYWRDARRRRMLALADLGSGVVAGFLLTSGVDAVWALAMLPLWVALAKLFGLYDRDHRAIRHLTVDEVTPLAGHVAACVVVISTLLALTPAGEVSIETAVTAWIATVFTALVLRAMIRMAWRRVTSAERTAIIGEGELADAVVRKIVLFRDMHLEVVDQEQFDLGELDRVILADEDIDPGRVGDLAVACRLSHVKLSVVSPLRGRSGPAPRLSRVGELPVLEYDTFDVSRSTTMIKRGLDVAIALAGLGLFLPALPLLAILIKLDTPGPVFFVQPRAGIGGEPFRMWKLRTMTEGAHEQLFDVISLNTLREPAFKIKDDPRTTRVGRILRRFSLDELPQLFNVLKGDMSIVGPRPEQMELVERYQPQHLFRLAVKPGMTGPMQINGRGALSFADRLALELDYVENISAARDLWIIAQTIPTVIRGTGAW